MYQSPSSFVYFVCFVVLLLSRTMHTMSMKHHLFLTLLLSLSSALLAADPADTHPDLHLIPWPKSIEVRDGRLPITADSRILAEDKQLLPLAEILAGELKLLTGLNLKTTTEPGRAGDIVLRLDPKLRADQPILAIRKRELVRTTEGAHTIEIADRVVVTGSDYRATAEGSSTL